MNVQKIGKCWFFGDFDTDLLQRNACSEKIDAFSKAGYIVVRADDSTNIYVTNKVIFDLTMEKLTDYRKSLAGKQMLLLETALHKNVVDKNGEQRVYYTFGNFFGANSVLLRESDAVDVAALAGKKMSNVQLAFSDDGDIASGMRWEPRDEKNK